MKESRVIFTVVFLILVKIGIIQAQCTDQEFSFKPGEKIIYQVAYNWGIVWIDAGEVYFKTDSSKFKNKGVYEFEAFGTSYHYYDWIYKVRDLYQAKIEPLVFQPLWFSRKTSEGGIKIFNQYDYDTENSYVLSQVQHDNKKLKTDTLPLEPCRFDVLSAVYYARNIQFDLYQPGDKIPVKFIIEDEFYDLFIRYHGKEIIQNRSGKKYRCHKLSAMLVEGTIFSAGEDLWVWITDDKNKIPVMAEAKILVGSVKAYLTSYEGLKYNMEAEVK